MLEMHLDKKVNRVEDTIHYLLHCHHFCHLRDDLMNSVSSVCENFITFTDNVKKDILLYGDPRLDGIRNKLILEATINYIKKSERFSSSIFE